MGKLETEDKTRAPLTAEMCDMTTLVNKPCFKSTQGNPILYQAPNMENQWPKAKCYILLEAPIMPVQASLSWKKPNSHHVIEN